jgi:DNA repair protein RecN (Recombination protein N)
MLRQLKVQNLAIVEEATIKFGQGLNIITGETGAGKSVLMGALNLVMGERADKSIIRSGADESRIEAAFSLDGATLSTLDTLLNERGIPSCEESTLLIKRVISNKGTGQILINDAASTAQTLREIGSLLVDIHGPYDQQSLLKQDFQRALLDAYGKCAQTLNSYQMVWNELNRTQSTMGEFQTANSDPAAEREDLLFMINEISSAALTEADENELIVSHAQAANAEKILSMGAEINNLLCDSEFSAANCLLNARSHSEELCRILPEAEQWLNEIKSATLQVQELNNSVNNCLSRIEVEPDRVRLLEERMALVQRLKRKYGGSVAAANQKLEQLQNRLDELEHRADRIAELQQQISRLKHELNEKAKLLTHSREKTATRLSKAITTVLRDLGFLNASFDIKLESSTPASYGADEVIFEFAPNPGEPSQPLKAIASSGEIARVMLAVKAVLAAHDSIPILVFDEIDANIGGETGRAVGEKLRQVATSHQVISITHLPQSAVYGEQHIKIFKEIENNRTQMRARILDYEERVDEIARMLGGRGLTSVIESHAREMLDASGH